jgi:hypothetical protein
MKIQEIKRAMTKLNPDELSRFRRWFEKFSVRTRDKQFERGRKSGKLDRPAEKILFEKHLKELQGSLRGSGAMKALLEERRKDQ